MGGDYFKCASMIALKAQSSQHGLMSQKENYTRVRSLESKGSNVSYGLIPNVADERLQDHDNQVHEDGGLHSKAGSREHLVHSSTMNIELFLQSPQQQESKIITVSAPLTDEASDSDSHGARVASSPVSEHSFPELAQQEFVLELIPRKHNSNVARFWNYYVNTSTQKDEEQSQQNTEEETPAFSNDLAADSDWHRRRDVRLVSAKDTNGCNLPQTNMFQRWDIILLREPEVD
ncbi:hypothetical protein FRC09_020293 [Ceratobasidium sp. 395]|nr:hypothetical protein FRC09_020293 [Ceratobasidium sp. 395]